MTRYCQVQLAEWEMALRPEAATQNQTRASQSSKSDADLTMLRPNGSGCEAFGSVIVNPDCRASGKSAIHGPHAG